MLTVLVSVALLQASTPSAPPPAVAVVVSRRVAVSKELADAVARQVVDALTGAGMPGVMAFDDAQKKLAAAGVADPSTCQAKRACLAKLATALQAQVIVGVDVGAVQDDTAVSVEAVGAADGLRLAQRSFLAPTEALQSAAQAELALFAAAAQTALPAKAPVRDVPPADGRAQTLAVAPPPPSDPGGIKAAAERPSRTASYAAGTGAIAAAGAAIAFGLLGRAEQRRLPTTAQTSAAMRRSEANAIAARANTDYTVALSAAIASAALTSLAVLFWPTEKASH